MKLVLLGLPEVKYSWKNQIARDAKTLGWDVVHLSPRRTGSSQILKHCVDADLFLWAYTYGHEIRGNYRLMFRQIEKYCPTASLHMDLYWGMPFRERLVGRHPFWKTQYVFTADGGHQREFASRGVNHHWIDPGLESRAIFTGSETSRFSRHDVVFIGSCNHDRIHRQYRSKMIAWAKEKYGPRFGWYGGGKLSPFGDVRGDELNDLFASTKVVLGDSANPKLVSFENYWSDRIPVTLGRGGVLVHPELEGMERAGFIDGLSLRTFEHGNLSQLGNIVDELLEEDEQRKELRQNGMRLIQQKHTWAHKLQQIKGVIDES